MPVSPNSRRQHEPMARTQLYITQQQREDLQIISQYLGVTASEHMRAALDAYLGRAKFRAILMGEGVL